MEFAWQPGAILKPAQTIPSLAGKIGDQPEQPANADETCLNVDCIQLNYTAGSRSPNPANQPVPG